MVMEKEKYRYFMPCNTLSFALSVMIMILVVPSSQVLFLILHLCMVFMCFSYLLALDVISHYTVISDMIYYMSLYVIAGAYNVKLLYYPVKALLNEDWWLQGFSFKVSNCSSVVKWFYTDTAMRMKKQHTVLLLK